MTGGMLYTGITIALVPHCVGDTAQSECDAPGRCEVPAIKSQEDMSSGAICANVGDIHMYRPLSVTSVPFPQKG